MAQDGVTALVGVSVRTIQNDGSIMQGATTSDAHISLKRAGSYPILALQPPADLPHGPVSGFRQPRGGPCWTPASWLQPAPSLHFSGV